MPIQQLAPDVAAKIAAGEVVERPASVVKELIENSIDAGATQIRVDLSSGGLQMIRVTDNGGGISPEELPLALARHATSKVARIDDLEHIRSLGFRGEALASVAAVAELTLLSRQRGSEQGAQISALNGQLSAISVAASSEGTTITVRNLFSAVPARLKFLKSRNTEVSHCHHLLQQYALAYPEIRFNVFSEGRQIFATPGDGQLTSVLVEVYGLPVAEQMVPISGNEHPENPEYPIIHGYVSRPTCYKSTRQYISFFVNRRWVLSRVLTASVEGAYNSLLLTGRHPIAVVNIQLDPSMLDVNVHPAKTEIRFLKERRIFAVILRTIRAALLEEPEMPQWQPDSVSSGDEIQDAGARRPQGIVPTVSAPVASNDHASVAANDSAPYHDDVADRENSDALPSDSPWITVAEEEAGTKPPFLSRLWQSHIRSAAAGTDTNVGAGRPQGIVPTLPAPVTPNDHAPVTPNDAATVTSNDHTPVTPDDHTSVAPNDAVPVTSNDQDSKNQPPSLTRSDVEPGPARDKLYPPNDVQATTTPRRDDSWLPKHAQFPTPSEGAEGLVPQQPRRLPRLRVVGQVAQSYIVTEGEDGMYLIDQHAAHERILLERMVTSLKARTPISQLLLTPMRLSLSPGELEAIEEHQQQLEHIGFTLAIADDSTLEVRAVPSVLVKQMNARSLHELMVSLTSEESLGHTETWEERALANVACKAAIKANYFLTVSEMREMLEQLEQTKAPFSCCHGRPTMVHFGLSALARAFERR
jgi:DNA mismatch repair protein MutL